MTQAAPMAQMARVTELGRTTWARVQPRIRRIGGIAALVQAALLVALVFVNAMIYSHAHFTSSANLADPKVYLPAVASAPLGFIAGGALDVALGVTIALLALAFYDLLGPTRQSVSLPTTAAGLLSALLFIAYGLFGMIRLPMLASDYVRHPVSPDRAFTSFLSINSALLSAAVVVLGVWFLAASWAAVRAKVFGRGISYIGLGWGVLALLSPIEDVGLYALGQEILWPIWAVWTGVLLLRPPRVDQPVEVVSGSGSGTATGTGEPSPVAGVVEPEEGDEA